MKPMIVPGFGKSSTKFNVGFSWNLAYQFQQVFIEIVKMLLFFKKNVIYFK